MLQDSQRTVMDIGESVKKVNLIARQHYRENQLYPALSNLVEASAKTETLMGDLNNSLNCDPLFRFYNDALNAACGEGLFGLFVMLLSAVVSALFFTVLVWCNSHTWIYFKHKAKYVKVSKKCWQRIYYFLHCVMVRLRIRIPTCHSQPLTEEHEVAAWVWAGAWREELRYTRDPAPSTPRPRLPPTMEL